jgi:7-cyano-7-deazaguanine synthase in queuosine biosynthesis
MKHSFHRSKCPEYYFEFGHTGVRRIVPALPNGEQDFCGQKYFSNYGCIAGLFFQRLSKRFADWAELALAIYIADRFSPRRDPRCRMDIAHRRRKIYLQIAVFDVRFWKSTEVQQRLQEALWILTEDDWQFEFLKRETPLTPCAQEFLFSEPCNKSIRVALFSGGLDSFAGAVHQLRNHKLHHVFVSGVTHARMGDGQRQQMASLQQLGNDFRHLQIEYGLKEHKIRDNTLEGSQRSRAFMHITLGAITALHAGKDELYMYENGIGALNLPFDATQIGIETSKGANPVFHRAMENFIETVGNRPFRIINPFIFLTKAQALREAQVSKFGVGLAQTFSCDRFPNWREGQPQCGTCASCILRRLSIESADLGEYDLDQGYARNIISPAFIPDDSAARVLAHFDKQVLTLQKVLNHKNPWKALAIEFPELFEIERSLMSNAQCEETVHEALIQLVRKHVNQWRVFSGRAALDRYLNAA